MQWKEASLLQHTLLAPLGGLHGPLHREGVRIMLALFFKALTELATYPMGYLASSGWAYSHQVFIGVVDLSQAKAASVPRGVCW
jgi:hypothetical protein